MHKLRPSFFESGQFGAFSLLFWAQNPCIEPHAKIDLKIQKAGLQDLDAAFQIVAEYYEAMNVIARDGKTQFQKYYFGAGSGVWLASINDKVVGCIALRELPEITRSAEIKRMYVQSAYRQHGIARSLLSALESFAVSAGYDWLYLDSAPGMDTAINFYKRNGYQACERYNDNPQANIYLRKKIC